MKKILMISYDWPPRGSVGMIRPARFAKYLLKMGYDVSVLTKDVSGEGNIYWDIEEPILDKVKVFKVAPVKRNSFSNYVKEKLYRSQFKADWFCAVRNRINTLLKDIKPDVVISSSPPEGTHLIAAMIKEKLNKPWIADLRDLWSRDHYRNFGLLQRSVLDLYEKSVLNKADIIMTVSETWADFLKKRYGGRVRVVTNGYDNEYFERIPYKAKNKFTISYLGKLNALHQDISAFLDALKDVIENGKISGDRLEVNFYVSGYGKPDIKKSALKRGLWGIVNEYNPVPLSKALAIMKNSSLLLLVGWKGLSSEGWRPQKVYEYLGSGTPIFLVNGKDNKELIKMVHSTQIGSVAKDISDIEREITRHYNNFISQKQNKIDECKGIFNEYNASNITAKLCQLIEEIGIKN